MSKDFGRTFVLTAALLAAPALAKAGCWDNCCSNWDEFKRACSCDGGDAYPNPPRCVPRGGGGGYTPPPAPVDPRILQNQRYQKIVQAGGAAGVIDANHFAGLPIRTDDDFAAALDRLNLYLRRSLQVDRAERSYFSAMNSAAYNAREQFYKPFFAQMDGSGIRPDIRAAKDAARERHMELETEIARIKDLAERFERSGAAAAASRLHIEEGRKAKRSLWAHLGGISREEVESFTETTVPAIALEPCCEERPRAYDPIEYVGAPDPERDPGVILAQEERRNAMLIVFPPPLKGDFDSRLSVVEAVEVEAEQALAGKRASQSSYERNWADDADRKAWKEMVGLNTRFLEDTHLHLSLRIPRAQRELKAVLAHFDAKTRKMYIDGARGVAWSLFSRRMLFPELKRVSIEVFPDRPFGLSDAQVEHAWKLDKHALFGAYKDWKKATKAYNLYETAARIEGSFQAGALAMTDLTGRAEPGDYQGLGDEITRDVDTGVREELKKSLERIDIPAAWRKIWVDGIKF